MTKVEEQLSKVKLDVKRIKEEGKQKEGEIEVTEEQMK